MAVAVVEEEIVEEQPVAVVPEVGRLVMQRLLGVLEVPVRVVHKLPVALLVVLVQEVQQVVQAYLKEEVVVHRLLLLARP